MKVVFPVLYFGRLPAYFPFWAKSCLANKESFHWIIYNDHVRTRSSFNEAVELVPYTPEQMVLDFQTKLGIKIGDYEPKKILELRAFMYFLRKKEEDQLDRHDFFGMTDLDVVYGRIERFLPPNWERFGLITAHEGRPCGPFSLIKREAAAGMLKANGIRGGLAEEKYYCLEEAPAIYEEIRKDFPTYAAEKTFQPWRNGTMDKRAAYGVWESGDLTVRDTKSQEPAPFFHYSIYKNKRSFKVFSSALDTGEWVVNRNGIWSPERFLQRFRNVLLNRFRK